jgi:alpha-1,2-mannosyltransferase
MPETCRAPDGSQPYTLGMTKSRTILVAFVLGFLPLVVVLLGRKLMFGLGNSLGFYLRNKTAGRKAQVLEATLQEEEEWEKSGREKEKARGRRDSDEWESVDAYAVGSAKNGEKADQEWDGIVGFFHPFWYANLCKSVMACRLT